MSDIIIPGFELIELIGRGGMASVWKARQVSLDRTVAIKILSSSFSDQSADINRFHEEAKHAARLRHHGIVQVYDAGMQAGLYYFVMECIDGYTVGDWLRRKGVLSDENALAVVDCVADALGYAWDQEQTVHCDVKPDNILIDSDGTVKIADLGLARTLNAMSRAAQDDDDDVMGTPAFMSPEQARGEEEIDCRADIYSMGAMLYELVTGHRMFEDLSDEEAMEQQCVGQAAGPHEINASVSPGMSELIERLLVKDKADRPSDWGEVRKLVHRLQRHMPLPPLHHPDSLCSVRRRKTARHPAKSDAVHNSLQRWKKTDSARTVQHLVAAAVIIALALVIYALQSNHLAQPIYVAPPARPQKPVPRPRPAPAKPRREHTAPEAQQEPVAPSPPAVEVSGPAQQWADMERWIAQHPENPDEGVRRIEELLPSLSGSSAEPPARSELTRLANLQAERETAEAERAAAEAERETAEAERAAVEAELTAEAALRAEGGERLYQRQTEEEHKREDVQMLGQLLDKPAQEDERADPLPENPIARVLEMARREARRESDEDRNDALEKAVARARAESMSPTRIAKSLLNNDMGEAERLVEWWERKVANEKYAYLVSELHGEIQALSNMDARVLKSFAAQAGMSIEVRLASSVATVTIEAVVGDHVRATRDGRRGGTGTGTRIEFGVADLSMVEKLMRMGSDEASGVALARGLMAYRCGAYEHARRYFSEVSPLIATELLEAVDTANQEGAR